MSPSLWIQGAMIVGGWFIGLPFALAYGREGESYTLVGGFALVWGITLGIVLFVWAMVAIDAWWLRRRGGQR